MLAATMSPLWRGAPSLPGKVTLPQPSAKVLHRPRLYQRLDEAVAGVWIAAPAAAGKSTLAAASLQRSARPALWYQIDHGDLDPGTFFHFLGLAAAALPLRRGRLPALPRYGREVGDGLADFARAWLRALAARLGTPVTIVLDDWHHLPEASPLQAVLPAWLDPLPDDVRLWLLSRHEPPPQLDGVRVRGRLATLGFADLMLTGDEAASLLALQAPDIAARRPGLAERWHRWCDGWVGALVFALATGREEPDSLPATLDAEGSRPLFGFLATELFEQAPAELREFMLITAWAPFVSESLSRELTGGDASQHIRHLLQRNLLTRTGTTRDAGWRYHRLLREFLLERARQTWSSEALRVQQLRAAAALEAAGLVEPAAERLIDAAAWPQLVPLLLRHAPLLLQQGRYATLAGWAQALPAQARTPWVEFWWAGALLARDARLGYQHYERAYAGFWDDGNAEGLYRSWCGAIEGISFACDDYGLLEQWLRKLRELRQRFPRFPSFTVRAQVTVYGFAATFFLDPRAPEFAPWLRSVQRLYRFAPRRADRAAIGALLALYHTAQTGMGALGAHLHSLRPLLADPAVPPFHRLVGGLSDVIHHWIAGSTDDALLRLADYDRLARETGAHAIDKQFAFQSVYVHCLRGELAAADHHLQRVAAVLDSLGRIDVAQYQFLLGWRAALGGRFDEAERLLAAAVDDTRRRRFAFLEAITRGLLAELLASAGRHGPAREHGERALQLAEQLGSVTAEVACAVQRAAVAELAGDDDATLSAQLARAFGSARRHGHWAWGGLHPPTLARLVLRALELGVESDYARALAQRHQLAPPPAAALCGAWPWPLKVFGLGELQLRHDELPVERSSGGGGRTAQRPLDLVRALLAHTPQPLPVATALHWIWPDADGSDQRKAFDVALLRARRLLGDETLLRLDGGSLAFDGTRVWSDVGALQALATRVAEADDADGVPRAPRWAQRLLELARGPLLAGDEAPWVQAARDRLRLRLAATAERLAGWLDATQPELARQVLQRAYEQDPGSEPLARRLATLLADADEAAEARRVMRLCLATRTLAGELPAAAQTQALARRLGL